MSAADEATPPPPRVKRNDPAALRSARASRTSRVPVPFTDEHGVLCYSVPLDDAGSRAALIERADFDRITSGLGLTAPWFTLSDGQGRLYVAVQPPEVAGRSAGPTLVGRLIVDAGPRQCVRYATRNTLDLRRPNLRTLGNAGAARHDSRDKVREAVERSRGALSQAA